MSPDLTYICTTMKFAILIIEIGEGIFQNKKKTERDHIRSLAHGLQTPVRPAQYIYIAAILQNLIAKTSQIET